MVIYANLILLVGLGVFHIVSLHELTSFRCGFWELYSEYPVQIICYLLIFLFSALVPASTALSNEKFPPPASFHTCRGWDF